MSAFFLYIQENPLNTRVHIIPENSTRTLMAAILVTNTFLRLEDYAFKKH